MNSRYSFLNGLVFAFQYRIGDAAAVQTDGFGRVVVTRDNVFHAVGAVVGVHYSNNRNTQFFGFNQSTFLVTGVDNENRVRQTFHVFDAAQ